MFNCTAIVLSLTLRAPKLRSPCGGSGSSPRRILLIQMPEMHFPASGTIGYRFTVHGLLHAVWSGHNQQASSLQSMLNFFMGLLRKRGEKNFCHPLLWGALAPSLATPLLTSFSLIPFRLRLQYNTYLGTRSNAFSRSTYVQ